MAPDLILQHANFNALTEACSQSPLVEHASFSTLPPKRQVILPPLGYTVQH